MLRELRVQVVGAAVFMLLQLRFLQDVGELFPNQILLLLVKDVDALFHIVEPRVEEDFLGRQALGNILFKHVLHEIASQLRHSVPILDFLLVQLVRQITDLVSFERHVAIQDSVEADTCRPNVNGQALVADLLDNFRGYVGRGATLLKQELFVLDAPTHSEVPNLDVAVTIEENVVQFDVTMDDADRMHVSDTLHYLLDEVFSILLGQLTALSHVIEEVAAWAQLLDDEVVLGRLEGLH